MSCLEQGYKMQLSRGGYSLVIPTWVGATQRGRDLGTTDLKLKGYPHLRRFLETGCNIVNVGKLQDISSNFTKCKLFIGK